LLKLGKPLAADLRDPAQRKQAVIKIAAAVLGLDVDQLVGRVQKHRAEQRRLLAAGSAAAAAVVLGLGVTAGVMANNANLANDRAFAQVEQLLTKTRANMDDLAAKKALHEAARLYFESKESRRLSDRDLLLKAEWLRQEGEDAGKRGEDERALTYRQDAYAVTTLLLKRNPDNPEFLFSHAQSAFWLGYYYFQHARPADARPSLEAYRTTAEHLLAVAPDYPGAMLEVHYARVNLGMLALEEERDPRRGAQAFKEALAVLDQHPSDLDAKLNLSRVTMQYIGALAQFASASEVLAVAQTWEPLIRELERDGGNRDDIDFHLASASNMIQSIEERTRGVSPSAPSRQGPAEDPDNLVSLSLVAELRLLEGQEVDCKPFPEPSEQMPTDRAQLRLIARCLGKLPAEGQAVRCSTFADQLSRREGHLEFEELWALLLTECSTSLAAKRDGELSEKLTATAARLFFSRDPEDLRLWTQLALAGFDATPPDAWITNLNASLDRRGWIIKGDN
jgi:hypothetical protein